MKPRDLLPIIERVRRATTNGDVLTICDALFKRVQHEVATSGGLRISGGKGMALTAMAHPHGEGRVKSGLSANSIETIEAPESLRAAMDGKQVDPQRMENYKLSDQAAPALLMGKQMPGNRTDIVIADDPDIDTGEDGHAAALQVFLGKPFRVGMPRTAMDAVVEHAEGGRKPATGKAKRAMAKLAARKAKKGK